MTFNMVSMFKENPAIVKQHLAKLNQRILAVSILLSLFLSFLLSCRISFEFSNYSLNFVVWAWRRTITLDDNYSIFSGESGQNQTIYIYTLHSCPKYKLIMVILLFRFRLLKVLDRFVCIIYSFQTMNFVEPEQIKICLSNFDSIFHRVISLARDWNLFTSIIQVSPWLIGSF